MIERNQKHKADGGKEECMGSCIVLKEAIKDLDKYKRDVLSEIGKLRFVADDNGKLFDIEEEQQ